MGKKRNDTYDDTRVSLGLLVAPLFGYLLITLITHTATTQQSAEAESESGEVKNQRHQAPSPPCRPLQNHLRLTHRYQVHSLLLLLLNVSFYLCLCFSFSS